MKIRMTEFGGIAPRVHDRRLPPSGAQIALNMDMNATVLRPIRAPSEYKHTQGDPIRSLYRYYIPDTPETRDAGIDPETHDTWFTWPFDVDVVKGQIAADVFGWVFFTGDDERGDYLKATYAYLDVHNFFNHRDARPRSAINFFIPRPQNPVELELAIPEDTAYDPQDIAETRVYTYTRVYTSAHGYEVESQPAPACDPIDVPLIEATDEDGNPVMKPAPVRVSGFTLYDETPHDFYTLAAHDGEPSAHWLGTLKYRFYRAIAGEYLLIKEVPIGLDILSGSAPAFDEFIDDVETMEILNVPLPSMDWDAPPEGMRGLINMPNGIMVGFKNYDIHFSEPYRPHAWPRKYVQPVDAEVVGLGVMDTTLVVLTRGTPYFAQGAHPDSITLVRGQMTYPCASKASIVSFENAVYYASFDGLIRLTSSDSINMTREIIEPWEWNARYDPEITQAWAHRAQYVAYYGDDQTLGSGDTLTRGQGYVYDMATGRMGFHHLRPGLTDHGVSAGHRDEKSGILHIAGKDGGTYYVAEWDAEPSTDVSLYWTSKEFELPFPAGFGWAQVFCDTYPLRIMFTIDGTHTLEFPDLANPGETTTIWEVQDALPFRLPVGHGRTWEFHIAGYNGAVYEVALAQSSAELKRE